MVLVRFFVGGQSEFQDGGDDVISRNEVLPPGECTRSVYTSAIRDS